MTDRKSLGLADLVLTGAALCLSIRWISPAAAAGPASLPLWAAVEAFYAVPLFLAASDLTARFSGEGGLYVWTRETFGPFAGFVSGWIYWTCNLPFFSGVLVYILNLLAVGLGPLGRPLLDHPPLFAAAAVVLCLVVGFAQMLGLGASKQLSNLGGLSTALLGALLLGCGSALALAHGPATDLVHADYAPPLNLAGASLWAVMVFGVGGSEALALLRNETRGGMRTVLAALVICLVLQAAFYVSGTAAMLAILTPAEASRLSGLPDALTAALRSLGLGGFAPAVLILAFLCSLGGYSAWFAVAARLPFAAGLDADLPPAFARRHPRTGAPTAAILMQTLVTAAIVLLSQAGASLKGAYDFLVSMSVLSYALPFLFVFAVYWKVQETSAPGARLRRLGARTAAALGVLVTLSAVAFSLIPSPDSRSPALDVLKLVVSSALLLGAGAVIHLRARSRAAVLGAST